MTTKTITMQIVQCDWCGKDSFDKVTFDNNSCAEDKDIHICDICREKHDDFDVWHKRDILEDSSVVIDQKDEDWTMTWGIVQYRENTNSHHFVKWIR